MPKVFVTTARVLYSHTDAAGVVYHSNYLEFFEKGRAELMREAGLPYSEVERRGIVLAITECSLRFRAPARYDDLLEIRVWVSKISPTRIGFQYEIRRHGEEKLLVEGDTRLASITREGRPVPMPDYLFAAVEQYLAGVEGYDEWKTSAAARAGERHG